MKRLTKILLLGALEVILVVLFLGLSETKSVIVTIFFPPLFAVTIYLLVLNIFKISDSSKLGYFVFALMLASIALFSTSIGYHFAANELDEFLIKENPTLQMLTEKLYYLDELFSHWIMYAGAIGIILAFIIWGYFRIQKKVDSKHIELHETGLMDLFILTFLGTLVGAIVALASIEAQVIKYWMVFVVVVMPFLLYRYKSYRIKTTTGKDFIIFIFTFFSSSVAFGVAYYLIKNSSYIVNIPFWK